MSDIKPTLDEIYYRKKELERTYPRFRKSRWCAMDGDNNVYLVVNRYHRKQVERSCTRLRKERSRAKDASNTAYPAVERTLHRYDGQQWQDLSQHYDTSRIYRLQADMHGRVWVLGSDGLLGFEGQSIWRFNEDGDSRGKRIDRIVTDSQGTLYARTSAGIYRLKGHDWTLLITQQDLPAGMESFGFDFLACDKQDRLWFCDRWNGLFIYDGTHIKKYTLPQPEDCKIVFMFPAEERYPGYEPGWIWIQTRTFKPDGDGRGNLRTMARFEDGYYMTDGENWKSSNSEAALIENGSAPSSE